ncbi:putative alpha-L-fucosidase [Pseudolycoriella hygida]|uniref:Putative alpha-L-fucosidase n=1 Tax=Pseudolycoriella hygida TaxID=35572 RepID=A0A9Q0RXZ6_9DIPT|nr:putative alpha-L-fucosidase [Pseudolycoriella hygida]
MKLRSACKFLHLLTIIFTVIEAQLVDKSNKRKEISRFEPNWESLDSRELPKWYDESKIGIFIHWGVYSVPAFGTGLSAEWFWTIWRSWNVEDHVNFMKDNFKPGFTYQDFARDFTGEHFNATEWVQLFAESGAKYVVITSKHHEGYTLWPSKYSFSWNSVDVGLHRDIICEAFYLEVYLFNSDNVFSAELSEACRVDNRIRFGVYHSLLEWYNPMYVSDRDSEFTQREFVEKKTIPELKELVMKYKPDIVWSDGEWEASYEYWNATEFLAWLYNDSPVSEIVVTNDRWGNDTMCLHGGFFTCHDRFNPGVLQPYKWENAMTIDKLTWGHRNNAKLQDFLTSKELIKELVVTVSCGGNILINVGPDKFGIIQPIFAERLRDMGKWLSANGEAIYESQPWLYQNDTITPDVWYTQGASINLRRDVFAIVLDYPYDTNTVELYSLFGYTDENTTIHVLGYPESVQWRIVNESVQVTLPNKAQLDKRGLNLAWTLKINVPE